MAVQYELIYILSNINLGKLKMTLFGCTSFKQPRVTSCSIVATLGDIRVKYLAGNFSPPVGFISDNGIRLPPFGQFDI